jgi:hypothetical protein
MLRFDLLWASIWHPVCQNFPKYLLSYGQSTYLLARFPSFLLHQLELVIGHGIGGKVIPAKMAQLVESQLLE